MQHAEVWDEGGKTSFSPHSPDFTPHLSLTRSYIYIFPFLTKPRGEAECKYWNTIYESLREEAH